MVLVVLFFLCFFVPLSTQRSTGTDTLFPDTTLFRSITLRLIADYSKREEKCCGGVLLNPVRSLTRGPDGCPVASPNTLLPLLQFLGANHQVAPAGASLDRKSTRLNSSH